MTTTKYIVLTLLCAMIGLGSFAQTSSESTTVYRGAGYDVLDTALIPAGRMEQQRDFLDNQYDFPARPRSQWELGISGGMFNVSGDVRTKTPFDAKNPGQTLGFGVHLRKAWGYVISTRLQYLHGTASGFNWQGATGYNEHNNPWANVVGQNGSGYNGSPVFYNYCTNVDELSLQLVAALNNIKFHKARNKASLYALAGIGGMLYDTWVDALNARGNTYNSGTEATFQSILDKNYTGVEPANATWPWNSNTYKTRKAKNTDLNNLFDGEYESAAERHGNRPWIGSNNDRTYRTIVTVGLGIQFKLGQRVSLSIEDKWTYTNDDLIDGQRWQEWPQPGNGGSALTREFDAYNYASIGLNLHLGGNSVEPLWWMNPLDYGYNELKNTNDGCAVDTDGDGVSDCFDRCPDTPVGVAVDTHGCPMDTDGDGVADYKDKQLITPTECQPSDADGIGSCPDPECCKDVKPARCGNIQDGAVNFPSNSSKLSSSSMSQLSTLATQMRQDPSCKVVITGNGSDSKVAQQRSWDRVNAIINYMVDRQGVDRDRFIFQYGRSGNGNTVQFRSAGGGEEGPSNLPPPFPNLSK